MAHVLVVPGFLGPHGGFENYVDAVVTVALGAGHQVTVVTDRSALGRTDVAERWVGRAELRSAEADWRSTPGGRLTVGAALVRDTARRRTWPTSAERRQAGETRAIPAIEVYWSAGPGVDLMASADLVHLIGKPKPWVCAALRAAHGRGVPSAYAEVAQVTPDYATRPDLVGFAEVASLVDLAVCFYDEQADDLRERFGYEGPAVRVEQWADGLEDALLALPVPRTLDAGPDEPIVVGSLSRLGPEKGLDTLVHGFALAAAADHRLRLRIAGTGSEGPAIEALVDSLGVGDRVELVGYVDDRVSLLAGLDVFVVSSIEEGGPISGVEAMAAARPIVSTAAGAMRERIRDGVDGLRFDAGDADALAARLVDLATDPARRAQLGAAARDRYVHRNHSSVTIPALVAAWDSLLA
ncbi:MAG: glycosyltransferase family 4 protein [Acidimicrobiales bacterium]